MFKLGYHTRGAILPGPHLLMTRLAAKQSHYCGLFLPQPTPRHRHRGRQPSSEREREGDAGEGEREGGVVKKREREQVIQEIERHSPERKKRGEITNGVHILYRSCPNHLFIDHLWNTCKPLLHISVSLSQCQPCRLLDILLSLPSTHCTVTRINNAIMLTSTETDW